MESERRILLAACVCIYWRTVHKTRQRNTGDNKKVLSPGRGLQKGGYWERKETGWRYIGEEGRGGEGKRRSSKNKVPIKMF